MNWVDEIVVVNGGNGSLLHFVDILQQIEFLAEVRLAQKCAFCMFEPGCVSISLE